VLICISVLNEKRLCIFLSDGWMCLRNIELESIWIHDCLDASNDISMSKSTSSSLPISVPFPKYRENFTKSLKKRSTTITLYLDNSVG
jgi:hypothetical protein